MVKTKCILFYYIAFVYWTGHVGFQLMDTGSNPVRDANYAVVTLWVEYLTVDET